MKRLTFLTPLACFLVLNGCASPAPTVKSIDVKMTCATTAQTISFKRDMSAIAVYGKTIPLYSAATKDSEWIYGDYTVNVRAHRIDKSLSAADLFIPVLAYDVYKDTTTADEYTYSYDISNGKGLSFSCVPPDKTDLPLAVTSDYLSPSALQAQKEKKEKDKEAAAQAKKDAEQAAREHARQQSQHEAEEKAEERECMPFAQDIAEKNNLRQIMHIRAGRSTMGNITCSINFKDGLGYPHFAYIEANPKTMDYRTFTSY